MIRGPMKHAQAVAMFSALIRTNPDAAKAREALAISGFAQSLRPKPSRPAPRCRISGSKELLRGYITRCDEYLVEFPRQTSVRATLAALLLAGGWLKGAEVEARQVLKEDIRDRKARRVLLRALEKQGKASEAELLRQALEREHLTP
jgi:hypothetical protein